MAHIANCNEYNNEPSENEYEYDNKKQYTVPDFYDKFKDKLPLLIIVTGGYDGETKYDDFPNDQVIRVQRPCQQLRALGKILYDGPYRREDFASIPVKKSHRFGLIDKNNKDIVGNPQTMEELIANNKMPFRVKYQYAASNTEYSSVLMNERQNVEVLKTYTENYLQGNCIDNGVLHPNPVLLALSPNITVAVITGYIFKPMEMFNSKLKSMDFFVQRNVKFKENDGSPAITIFQRDAETTGAGNPMPPDLLETIRPALPPRTDKPQTKFNKLDFAGVSDTSDEEYEEISDSYTSDSGCGSWSTGSKSHLSDKSVEDVQDILKVLNLSKYCCAFQDHLIDGVLLLELNEEMLRKDFNFMHVQAVKLMKYVRSGHIPK